MSFESRTPGEEIPAPRFLSIAAAKFVSFRNATFQRGRSRRELVGDRCLAKGIWLRQLEGNPAIVEEKAMLWNGR